VVVVGSGDDPFEFTKQLKLTLDISEVVVVSAGEPGYGGGWRSWD
jgi:hypothetical protein